jgi:hypothetical protein
MTNTLEIINNNCQCCHTPTSSKHTPHINTTTPTFRKCPPFFVFVAPLTLIHFLLVFIILITYIFKYITTPFPKLLSCYLLFCDLQHK